MREAAYEALLRISEATAENAHETPDIAAEIRASFTLSAQVEELQTQVHHLSTGAPSRRLTPAKLSPVAAA